MSAFRASSQTARSRLAVETSAAAAEVAISALVASLGAKGPSSVAEDPQPPLFDLGTAWESKWEGMPEFAQQNLAPSSSIIVQFRNEDDRHAFLRMLGESPVRQQSIWYPKMEYLKQSIKDAPSTIVAPNQYPVYVISKGRWEKRLTVRALEKLGIPFHVVIEPQELESYAAVIPAEKILTLPFSNLGQGSIPARNWVWEHAICAGAKRHWILDDNIDGFYRLNNNLKVKVVDMNPLTPIEQFADRYENVAIAGMHYEFFADRRAVHPPFILNHRVYSCILIQNDLPYRWRGRYNEDTDLSIRVLKAGYCTVLFYAFLAKKMPTMTQTGGNTDELYVDDGRLKMAQSLQEQHPDIVTITTKWGRPQHQVNYGRFRRNKLVPKTGAQISAEETAASETSFEDSLFEDLAGETE
jgi:hypothetical protein